MNLEELHLKLGTTAANVMSRKNADYSGGGSIFANFEASEILGISVTQGIALRCFDKLKRIQSFVAKGKLQVVNEGAIDSAEDIRNYIVLATGWTIGVQTREDLLKLHSDLHGSVEGTYALKYYQRRLAAARELGQNTVIDMCVEFIDHYGRTFDGHRSVGAADTAVAIKRAARLLACITHLSNQLPDIEKYAGADAAAPALAPPPAPVAI